MIGDSWISLGKMTDPVRDALARRGVVDVPVRSFGQGGAVSRQILRNLASTGPADPAHSSRAVLEAGDVRYCVVIAGVNDSAQHLGPDFYAHHTTEIARALLAHGITPLIVELPEYGIETLYAQRTGVYRAKDLVLSRLFDDGEIDVIEKYRSALRRGLIEAGLATHVTLVDFEEVATDFDASRELYTDPSHLNAHGRARLAAVLADALVERFARDGRAPASVQVASR
jgi:lysophospholipase L1-like esterase